MIHEKASKITFNEIKLYHNEFHKIHYQNSTFSLKYNLYFIGSFRQLEIFFSIGRFRSVEVVCSKIRVSRLSLARNIWKSSCVKMGWFPCHLGSRDILIKFSGSTMWKSHKEEIGSVSNGRPVRWTFCGKVRIFINHNCQLGVRRRNWARKLQNSMNRIW